MEKFHQQEKVPEEICKNKEEQQKWEQFNKDQQFWWPEA